MSGKSRRPARVTRLASVRVASDRTGLRGGAPAQERELRAQGRKTMRRLLDAGRFVFEKRGFHAARVDDIVRVARTSHGTFYLYFANKEDLFKALAHDAMTQMAELVELLGPVTPDPAGRAELRAWVARFCEIYRRHGNVIRSWTEGDVMDNELGQQGRELLLALSGSLSGRMLEGSTPPVDPQAAGVACLSMLERFNYFVQAKQVDFAPERIVDTLTDAAFYGFFAAAGLPAQRLAGRAPRG